MKSSELEPLFEPFKMRHINLRNRFIMPAMQLGQARNNVPPEATVPYYQQRAQGGVALIISEACGLDHPSSFWQPIFAKIAPNTADIWGRTTEAVKRAGAHFFIQLWHPGAMRRIEPGLPEAAIPSLSPSGIFKAGHPSGRAATKQELEDIKEAFVEAALLTKRAGADGVELHSAHGYLLDQFLWAETNVRDDEYGGQTLAERARYPAEVVTAIRRAVGEDFVIGCRFSQFKEIDYDATLVAQPDELGEFLSIMRRAGVDYFHVSTRRFSKPEWPGRSQKDLGLAGWVKSMTDAPVITIGSVGLDTDTFSDLHENQDPKLRIQQDLALVLKRFERGEFDLVGVGRNHIANPDFVTMVRAGRFDELECFNKAIHLKAFLDDFDLDGTIRGGVR